MNPKYPDLNRWQFSDAMKVARRSLKQFAILVATTFFG
jgi:hypothetical protein